MSDTGSTEPFDPEDYEGTAPKVVQMQRRDIRALERKGARAEKAEAEAAAARRELAMYRAGIPDTPVGKLFLKAYDGPAEDPDAIRSAAVEYGVLEGNGPSGDEMDAHQRTMNASAGANQTRGPGDVGDLLSSARSDKEVLEIMRKHPGNFPGLETRRG